MNLKKLLQRPGNKPVEAEETTPKVDGERGLPSVNKSTSIQSKVGRILVILVVLAFAGSLLVRYYMHLAAKRAEESNGGPNPSAPAKNAKQNSGSALPAFAPPAPPAPETPAAAPDDPNRPPAPPTPSRPGQANSPGGTGTPAVDANGQPIVSPEQALMAERLKAPVVAKVDGVGSMGGAYPVGVQSNPNYDDKLTSRGLGESLKATYTPGARATLLPDRNFIIAKGTFLDCELEDEMDSTVSGLVSCTITRDVWSDNGRVVLMEKGTTCTGEYMGDMKQGQARIGVLWTRAKTPQGVVIDLASPGTDHLGRAGLDGFIDNHFWTRFGAAMMISLIQQVGTIAASRAAAGSANVAIQSNPVQPAQDLATEVFKGTANLPPTLHKHRGERIGVKVARDLDFRGVYALRKVEQR